MVHMASMVCMVNMAIPTLYMVIVWFNMVQNPIDHT